MVIRFARIVVTGWPSSSFCHLLGGSSLPWTTTLSAAVGHDRERARAVLAFAHGMVLLEMDGRFPPWADVDGAWESGLAALSPARRPMPDRGRS